MKSTTKFSIAFAIAIFLNFQMKAQVKMGNNPTTLNASAELELESTNRGLLLPRLALTATTSFAPLTAHVAGMTVYNTATAGDVVPAYYYNDGTKWVQIAAANDFWRLKGNTGTNDAVNFLGTTDLQALHFRVNGTPVGLLDYASAAQGAYPGANVIFGYDAAPGITSTLNNASNNNNVIIGYKAGNAQTASYRNIYIGARAGLVATTAHENVIMGWEAGLALTTGNWNTSLGTYAGQGMTTGTENVSVGFHAGEGITTGGQNISVGDYAGGGNATGNANTFLGFLSGTSVDGLSRSAAIGYKASVSVNDALVLGDPTNSNVKVGIGTSAPTFNLDIVGNVAGNVSSRIYNKSGASNASAILTFGSDADQYGAYIYKTSSGFTGANGANNFIFTNAQGALSFFPGAVEKMRVTSAGLGIGTTAPTATLHVVGTTLAAAWTVSSDARLKKNIVALEQGAINKVMQLNPVSYDKKETLESKDYNKKEMGFIAQDLKKLFPNVVQENGKDKLLSVNYTALIPVLTKAIQELKNENDALKTKNVNAEKELASLKSQMESLSSLSAQVKELQAIMGVKKSDSENTMKASKK